MELSTTITQQEYHQDLVETRLREIFEPNSYIATKPEISAFDSIRARISEMIESIISPNNQSFDEQINDEFLELDLVQNLILMPQKLG